jgi:glutathione synthase/RimK-type ligase-like ATP-grasp enzyme
MAVKLAIHHRDRSFSNRWIEYCQEHRIPYSLVNCLDSDIIAQLQVVDGLLWNWSHQEPGDQSMACQLIKAAEAAGVVVFPNTATCWHYDDKIGQKYLLEAIGAPLVPTSVLYSLPEVIDWIEHASFPKVFKLRRGAGSSNVQLVRNADEARSLARRAFTKGFWPVPSYVWDARRRYRSARQQGDLWAIVLRIPTLWAKIRRRNRVISAEKGYAYFQEFIGANSFDTRVTIIGNRAFAFTRNVRPRDFRASGSGDIHYDLSRINLNCIRTAFEVAHKIGAQSLAFDFVLDENQRPLILEISYSYKASAVYNCSGHWDNQLNWHSGHMWPQDAIMIDLLQEIARRKRSAIQTQPSDHQAIGQCLAGLQGHTVQP